MSEPFEANGFPLGPGLRLLEASAGTGKTFALAHLVLRFIAEAELNLGQLLVVTFTEAAAAELRDRIGKRLQAALSGLDDPAFDPPDPTLDAWLDWARPRARQLQPRLLLALEDLDGADITTIHGFCLRTLQRQALEAAQPPGLSVDTDSPSLLRQISHDYWCQQLLPLPTHLLGGVRQALNGPDDLFAILQRLDGDPALQLDPLPPGIRADEALPPQLELLWQEAWERFGQRWAERGEALQADILSAAAEWRALGLRDTKPYAPRVSRDRHGEVSAWIGGMPPGGDYAATRRQDLLRTYFHPGSFLKVARLVDGPEPSLPQRPLLEAIAAVMEGPAEAALLHAAHWGRAELRQRRERSGRVGFGQLLEGLDPGETAAAPGPLLQTVGERYAAALIDEFQDTDPIQWRILSQAFDPARHRLVLVGDPKQAIYRFRGGELATYRRAEAAARDGGGVYALSDNYRSTPALVAALNALMAPGLRRSDLPVPPVRARAAAAEATAAETTPAEAPPVEAPASSGASSPAPALQLLWLGGDRATGEKPVSATTLDQGLPGRIASFAAGLLNAGQAPGDLCVLVSTHSQAERLRAALERSGIASRLVSKGDVFESAAATALQRFLDALARPADPGRLRLLAASPLLGWSAAAIAAATPEQWSELAGQLARGAEQLPGRGLLGVLSTLLNAPGLARLAMGGRLLADLEQCAELVQQRLHADQLGPAAAADWLRRRRLEPDRDPPEAEQPNSDVADAAVWVVTVHRSKGLEYPVVISPFFWKAPRSRTAGGGAVRLGVRWQPPEAPQPVLDLHLNSHWGRGHGAAVQHELAELQEQERLAYVAATRAKQLLVLAWGPAAGQQGNPLHPWLFAQDPVPGRGEDPYAALGDAAWRARLEAEIDRRELPLAVLDPPPAGVVVNPPAPAAPAVEPALQCGPVPTWELDRRWGRYSYSRWTQGSHAAAPQALEEGRETDGLVSEPDPDPSDQAALADNWPGESPLADFPRGSQAGDCLHRILEQLNYRQAAAAQAGLCSRELQRSGLGPEHLPGLLAGLEALRLSPMGGALGPFHLAELEGSERLNEMNFDLPLGMVRADDLARPFRTCPGGAFGRTYASRLAELDVASRGFLTGSIDLVFRRGE
ncbi:UvrD-helicase domain-containing protein, partial [Aphanothece microscopica]